MALVMQREIGVPRQLVGLAVALGIVAIAAGIGGWFTNTSLDTWYEDLAKPSWTPPGAVIGAVWTVLYALMGFAAWLVWRASGFRRAQVALWLFGAQLLLNVGWSAVFFGLRSPGGALAEIIVLWVAILATIVTFARHSRLAAVLMAPYLAWVSFATGLTAAVWNLN